jgi:hypothetical protein
LWRNVRRGFGKGENENLQNITAKAQRRKELPQRSAFFERIFFAFPSRLCAFAVKLFYFPILAIAPISHVKK